MKDERSQQSGDEHAQAQNDIAALSVGKKTLTEGVTPAAATSAKAHDPDDIDREVAKLPADQKAYYDQIIAESATPESKDTRKEALTTVKSSRTLTEDDRMAIAAAKEKLASMHPTPIDDGKNPNLVQIQITFDGTWNSRDDMMYDTNPALINDMFKGEKDYQVGVGTSASTKIFGGAFGAGITNRINGAYENLVATINRLKSANPKAEVVLIVSGFSRGSTAARAFVNELNKRGIPDLGSADGKGGYARQFEGPRIGAMILFDTVGSVGIPGTNLNPGLDLSIPANAENVLHLTAGDEHRAMFPLSSAVDPKQPGDSRISEIELPGAHSDVGGSYPNAYSKIPLHMTQDYMTKLGVNVPAVKPEDEIDPNDPKLRLHDSGGSATRKRTVYPSNNPTGNN